MFSTDVTLNLISDDKPSVSSIAVDEATIVENGGAAIITATISAVHSKEVTIPLTVTGTGSNYTDFSYSDESTDFYKSVGDRARDITVVGNYAYIAGQGVANPIATILSFAMALRYSLDLDNEAKALEKAVQDVLNDGLRTKDIISGGTKEVSTSQMGDAIISKLQ